MVAHACARCQRVESGVGKWTATVAMSGLLSAAVAEDVETHVEYTAREDEVVVNVNITVTRSQIILVCMTIMAFVVIWMSRSLTRPQKIAELMDGSSQVPILAGAVPTDEADFGEGGSEAFSMGGVPLTAEQCRELGLRYIIPPRYTKGQGKGGDLSTLELSKDVASLATETGMMLKMNLDTGAAIHALPTSMGVDNKVTGEHYTTASGEKIPDMGQLKLTLEDEHGQSRRLIGNVTNVHKCLASASRMCAGGKQEIWLNGEGGVVFPADGPIAKGLAREYDRLVAKHGTSSLLPVYQERGVYNVYFKLLAKEKLVSVVQAVDKQKP